MTIHASPLAGRCMGPTSGRIDHMSYAPPSRSTWPRPNGRPPQSCGACPSPLGSKPTTLPAPIWRDRRFFSESSAIRRPRQRRWGVGEHTDYGLLTLLAQDEMGGLQVRTGRGWIDVPPVADTLVVNVGDMLERLSGGRFVSAPHRVRNAGARDRLSFPLFYDPDFSAVMTPAAAPAGRTAHERWDKIDPNAFFRALWRLPAAEGRGGVSPDLKGCQQVLTPLSRKRRWCGTQCSRAEACSSGCSDPRSRCGARSEPRPRRSPSI